MQSCIAGVNGLHDGLRERTVGGSATNRQGIGGCKRKQLELGASKKKKDNLQDAILSNTWPDPPRLRREKELP